MDRDTPQVDLAAFHHTPWQPFMKAGADGLRPVAVYRIYNSARMTIYIGTGFEPLARIRIHYNTASWGGEIDGWSADWYHTRLAAELVEARLIEIEQPVYNIRGTDLHRLVSTQARPPMRQGEIKTYARPAPAGARRARHGVPLKGNPSHPPAARQ